jgi:hypothetical protein
VQIAEVQIGDADFGEWLKDIRLLLDANRLTPSTFTYFFLILGMRLRVAFAVDHEAVAFAGEFGRDLLDWVAPGYPGLRAPPRCRPAATCARSVAGRGMKNAGRDRAGGRFRPEGHAAWRKARHLLVNTGRRFPYPCNPYLSERGHRSVIEEPRSLPVTAGAYVNPRPCFSRHACRPNMATSTEMKLEML